MGAKASSGMGLPMLDKMSYQRREVSSHPSLTPFPLLFPIFCFGNVLNHKTLPTPPLSLCSVGGGGWLTTELTIRLVEF
jgi:hypothetical protein